MTESDQVEFREPVNAPGGRSLPVRLGIMAGAAILFVVGAVAAMGASPSPSTTTADPAVSAVPSAGTTFKSLPGMGDHRMRGGLDMRGGFGVGGLRDITITAVDGSNVSLRTDDGWTRTITVTSATTITKGGAPITVGDLAVGDQVRFSQDRASDGTYSITAIRVVLPTVVGEVSAIDGTTITVTQPGGTTATIHVSSSTTYVAEGVTSATLSDIKVGSVLVAEGTQRADGSLDAATVRSGFARGGHGGPGMWRDHHDPATPNATPAPSPGAG